MIIPRGSTCPCWQAGQFGNYKAQCLLSTRASRGQQQATPEPRDIVLPEQRATPGARDIARSECVLPELFVRTSDANSCKQIDGCLISGLWLVAI